MRTRRSERLQLLARDVYPYSANCVSSRPRTLVSYTISSSPYVLDSTGKNSSDARKLSFSRVIRRSRLPRIVSARALTLSSYTIFLSTRGGILNSANRFSHRARALFLFLYLSLSLSTRRSPLPRKAFLAACTRTRLSLSTWVPKHLRSGRNPSDRACSVHRREYTRRFAWYARAPVFVYSLPQRFMISLAWRCFDSTKYRATRTRVHCTFSL